MKTSGSTNATFAALLIVAAVGARPVLAAADTSAPAQARLDVPSLIQELKSPDLRERQDAARQLAGLEQLPPDAIQALAESLQSSRPDDASERYATIALSKAGVLALPALTEVTKSRNPQVCQAAVSALGRIAMSQPAAWPILIGVFGSGYNRENAARALARVGPPVVPLLRQTLASGKPRERAGAAETLAMMGWFAQMYRQSDEPARKRSGIVFTDGTDLAAAAPELARAVNDPDPGVRNQAAIALAYADPNDRASIPILAELLNNQNLELHDAAVSALEAMGAAAHDAVPALERALGTNPDAVVRCGAARALALSGAAEACAPLARAIGEDPEGNVRAAAAAAMIALGPACSETVRVLAGTLGRREFSANDELAKLGVPAVPALADALKSHDLDVREAAVDALAKMKALSPGAVEALMFALRDQSLEVRSQAAAALSNAGGEAEKEALAEQDRAREVLAERAKPDMRRYAKAEIVAPIPADPDHKYPLTLAYLVPIYPIGGTVRDARILVTLHIGEDRPERLVIWKKLGDDEYQKLKVVEPEDPDFRDDHFEAPITFQARESSGNRETKLLFDGPIDRWRSRTDQVFAVDRDGIEPVEIESSAKWYQDKLGPREAVRQSAANSIGDSGLEFSFAIWNVDDAECRPSAGRVTGTYKLIEVPALPLSGACAIQFPGSGTHAVVSVPHEPIGAAAPTLKMVVDTATRVPPPTPGAPLKKPAPSKAG